MTNPNHKYCHGWHHLYLGVIIILVGFRLLFTLPVAFSLVTVAIGLYVMADDYYQHFRQNSEIDYHSPLHRLYAGIKKPLWIVWINNRLDDIFKGGK